MAKKSAKENDKLRSRTVRERAEQAQKQPQPRRLHKATSVVKRPFSGAGRLGKKVWPSSKSAPGKILHVIGLILVPRMFRNAWRELLGVTWPTKRETWQLTIAVFVFAIIFGILIAITDFGLDKIFHKLLLG